MPGTPRRETIWFWLCALLFLLMEYAYAWVHQGLWDDDCATRIFNVEDALRHPAQFVASWNRPLFVALFALPLQLGRWTVPVLMPLLTLAGAWALHKALLAKAQPAAWLVAPLYLLGSYVFGTSRFALTEPLAATLICFGLLAFTRQRWMLFALLGGLLPLARMELAPLLLLWAVPLWQHRKAALPLLASGLALWCLASVALVGDLMHPFKSFLEADAQSRYGSLPLHHYAERYIHVVGPVSFPWLMVGLVEAVAVLRRKREAADLLVLGQWLAGLALYSAIATWFSAGNPAGYLRNLVPLSPLAALLAHRGLTTTWAQAPHAPGSQKAARLRILATLAVAALLTAALFSITHTDRLDLFLRIRPLNLLFVAGSTLLGLSAWAFRRAAGWQTLLPGGALYALAAFFLFVAIPPDRFLSVERQHVALATQVIANSPLSGQPLHANHNWHFWSTGQSPYDGKTRPVTQRELASPLPGTVVLWDNHYGHRLGGDVDLQWLRMQPEWLEVFYLADPDGPSEVHVFQRLTRGADRLARLAEMKKAQPYVAAVPLLMAQEVWQRSRDTLQAMQWVEESLRLAPRDAQAQFLDGVLLAAYGRHDQALMAFSNAARLRPQDPNPWSGMGQSYEALGHLPEAREAYLRALHIAPRQLEANMGLFRLDSLEGRTPPR